MATAQRWKASTWEDVGLVLFDLVKGNAGSNVTVASVTALTGKVFNSETHDQISTTITFTVATSIFDTVQTVANDPRYDGTGGYNMRVVIPGTYFPTGDTTYRVELYFADTAIPANVFVDVWEVTTLEVIGT